MDIGNAGIQMYVRNIWGAATQKLSQILLTCQRRENRKGQANRNLAGEKADNPNRLVSSSDRARQLAVANNVDDDGNHEDPGSHSCVKKWMG